LLTFSGCVRGRLVVLAQAYSKLIISRRIDIITVLFFTLCPPLSSKLCVKGIDCLH
jgi:hypothetical protein